MIIWSHLPAIASLYLFWMTEGTDDSIIFASSNSSPNILSGRRTLFSLLRMVHYWMKILCMSFHRRESTHNTSNAIYHGSNLEYHHWVKLITNPTGPNELEFLRVKIDNPSHRFCELHNFVEAFTFPNSLDNPHHTHQENRHAIIASRACTLLLFTITDAMHSNSTELLQQSACSIRLSVDLQSEMLPYPSHLHGFNFPSIPVSMLPLLLTDLAWPKSPHTRIS